MSDEEKTRLLICHTCSSIDPLPWYDGPEDYDDTLNYRVAQHRFPNGDPHIGIMANVEKEDWDKRSYRDAIRDKIAEEMKIKLPGTAAGLGDTYYEVKSNFDQDAMACWKAHNRTTDCGDYRTRSKLLLAPTSSDRKDAGLDPKDRAKTYLCQFCPVESIIMQKVRKKQGLYDN